jgi:hypothetical protein
MFPRNLSAAGAAALLATTPITALADEPPAHEPVAPISTTAAGSISVEARPQASIAPQSYATPPLGEEEPRVLFPGRVKHGGYGGPELKLTSMNGDPALLVGGQGGWIIDHGFVIGAAGYGLVTRHDAPPELSPALNRSTLQLGYGGPRLSYVLRPNDLVHFTFGLLVGGGGFTILSRDNMTHDFRTHDSRAFFVMEPQAEVEANLVRHVRLAFGVSYRYIDTNASSPLRSSDLSGLAASVLVKAGSF